MKKKTSQLDFTNLCFLLFPGLGKEKEDTFYKIKEHLTKQFNNSLIIDLGDVYQELDSISISILTRSKIMGKGLFAKVNNNHKFIAICHSQGGITFLNMLNQHLDLKKLLCKNLVGMFFLGCPFKGNLWASLTKIIVEKTYFENRFLYNIFSKNIYFFLTKVFKLFGLEIKDFNQIDGFKDLLPKSIPITLANKTLKYLVTEKKIKTVLFHAQNDILVSRESSLAIKEIISKEDFKNIHLEKIKKIGHLGLIYNNISINKIISKIKLLI